MQACEDTLTIAALRAALRDKLEQLPAMLSDGIRNALSTMIPVGMSCSRQPAANYKPPFSTWAEPTTLLRVMTVYATEHSGASVRRPSHVTLPVAPRPQPV